MNSSRLGLSKLTTQARATEFQIINFLKICVMFDAYRIHYTLIINALNDKSLSNEKVIYCYCTKGCLSDQLMTNNNTGIVQ
ncbi:hypothetical protein E2986_12738 [Frieseomelitta varia]|uniref:Uncharacterized protein n=1 Tax=Frieseomelitta varia TaxID=561572 RepID=A0A833RGU6_9HYME|nr:hypothetical protein E2986_12738 [Frieseomelitta varia]